MSISVLIVEDDVDLREELADFLRGHDYVVTEAGTVRDAENALTHPFDLLVLDINLPDGNGFELCHRLRPYLRSGIVMCTGRSERELRIDSLTGGADAYLVKPVDPDELVATLISVYRRTLPAPPPLFNLPTPAQWRLDRIRATLISPSGASVVLTTNQVVLLTAVLTAPQHQTSRLALLAAFKGAKMPSDGRRIETMASRLRRKVLDTTGQQLPLNSVYGKGYSFTDHAVLV
jgi:DNA-binding response OmpR family regulator